jgi:hypothetical protein
VTAQDFYYSWMRTASPKNSSDAMWSSVMNYVAQSYAYHDGSAPASAVGVKVINPYEIQLGPKFLILSASYVPPLGELGWRLDRALLHRVAESTVRSFLLRLAASLEARQMPTERS